MLERPTSSLQRIGPEDDDPSETREWFDALDSVYWRAGSERAAFLLSSPSPSAPANSALP
jgi:pyruvate dehydrogenase complex dehydrogenase (E1) component